MPRFSAHARQRMIERNIEVADVAAVLDDPSVTFTDRKGNPCYIREIDGRRIKVVVDAVDTEFVITAIDLDA
jgi:Domain of unknown function (DUF4258)